MNKDKNDINHYTAEDIRRYLGGQMSREEMHAIEKASLNDPFLADAIEGFHSSDIKETGSAISDLHKKLQDRPSQNLIPIRPTFKLWKMAAAVILIFAVGYASYFLVTKPADHTSIAQRETKVARDSGTNQKAFSPDDSNRSAPAVVQSEKENVGEKKVQAKESVADESENEPEQALSGKASASSEEIAKNNKKSSELQKKNESINDSVVKAPTPHRSEEVSARKVQPAHAEEDKVSIADASNAMRFNYFRGQVVDGNNKAIPFANISIKNTNSVSYADAKGNFRLVAADSQLNVEVRSVGYVQQYSLLSPDSGSNQIVMQTQPDVLRNVTPIAKPQSGKEKAITAERENSVKGDDGPEAQPVDGWGPYQLYLLNNVRIPYDARQKYIKGTVELSFLVNEKGELSDYRIEKSLCSNCDREAIRLVNEGPKWKLSFGNKPDRVHVSVVF